MISDGAKIVPSQTEQPGIQQTTLAGLQDRAKQQAPLQALMAQMGGGGAGGPPGGAPPPTPQM
jgi:hypothetical protein